MALDTTVSGETGRAYAKLEERILERDQVGASEVLYGLLRDGRPVSEILGETVRVHAPYTHVPYHQRIDKGIVRFVNNDHCLLSARTSLRLPQLVQPELQYLPLAQTVWYVPTGLDVWNQLLGRMPGHYARRGERIDGEGSVPKPEVHIEDTREPVYLDGPFEERLNEWLTLVERGHVEQSYRVFLGLFEEEERRGELFAQFMFAGLIDVQDRMLYNRSYTTGHKSYRARATIELGAAVGWEHAGSVLFAGVPDMAVGPRWHSVYEMACQVFLTQLEREVLKSSLAPTPHSTRDDELFAQTEPLTDPEAASLIHALTRVPEPAYIDAITSLLLAGRSPLRILEAMQIASAQVVLETGHPENFSMPHHCFEYVSTLRWFYDHFEHPHRTKLLYVAGSFINQAAHWVQNTPGNGRPVIAAPRGSEELSRDEILRRLDEAMLALDPPQSVAWTKAYLDGGYERGPLVRVLATAATKLGNDPHNQEIGLCMVDDYLRSASPQRETMLLACAHHNAGHRKYGDPLESYRRFASAFDIDTDEWATGDGDPIEAMLDDVDLVFVPDEASRSG
jgi:hypothetical protein